MVNNLGPDAPVDPGWLDTSDEQLVVTCFSYLVKP